MHALSDLFYATVFCKLCISKFLKPKAKSDKTHAPSDLSFSHSGYAVFFSFAKVNAVCDIIRAQSDKNLQYSMVS